MYSEAVKKDKSPIYNATHPTLEILTPSTYGGEMKARSERMTRLKNLAQLKTARDYKWLDSSKKEPTFSIGTGDDKKPPKKPTEPITQLAKKKKRKAKRRDQQVIEQPKQSAITDPRDLKARVVDLIPRNVNSLGPIQPWSPFRQGVKDLVTNIKEQLKTELKLFGDMDELKMKQTLSRLDPFLRDQLSKNPLLTEVE